MNKISRRAAGRSLAAALASQALVKAQQRETPLTPDMQPPLGYSMADMGGLKHFMPPRAEQIHMLVYPGMTALDLIGPQQAFGYTMGAKVTLVWKDAEAVVTDTGVKITPDATFRDCGPADLIFVPGGGDGTVSLMGDVAVLDFLADQAKTTRWVTSVCSGSLVLGAAGLLRGYRATSHWAVREVLPALGAIPASGRIVEDRNRITAGGVTAGIDFGLYLVGKLRGGDYGRAVELMLEYDPQPPFRSGTPAMARADIRDGITAMYGPTVKKARDFASQARVRWARS